MPATKSSPRGRPELDGRREPFFRPNRGSWAARVPEWRRTEAIYSRDLNIELLEPDDSRPLNYTPSPPRRHTPRSARSSRARTLALSQPKVHSPRPPEREDVPTPPKSSRQARSRAASRSRCRRLSTPRKDYAPEPVHKKRGTKQQIMEQQETIRNLVARMHPRVR